MTRHPRRIRPSFGIESLEGRTLLSGSSHPSSSLTSQVHDVLVTFRPQSSPQRELDILEWSGAAVIADPASHTYLLAAGPGETLGTLIHRLECRTAVKSVKTVAAPQPTAGTGANRQSDVLVTFRPRTTHKREQAILKSSHAAVVAATAPHTYLLAPGPGQGLKSLIHRLRSNSPVKSVRAVAAPNPSAGTVLPVTLPGITIPTPPSVTTPNPLISTAPTVGDEVIVQFKTMFQGGTEVFTAAQQQQAAALIGSLGASVVASSPSAGFYVVAPASGSTPAATVAQLSASPLVGRAQPNYVYSTASGRFDDIGVTFQPGTTDQQVQALIQSLGDTIVSPGHGTEIYLIAPAAGTDLASALAALYASPLVVNAGQNSASSVNTQMVGDEVIVQFKTMFQGGTEVFTAAQQQQAAALIGSLGVSVVASTPSAGFYVVAPAAGSTPAVTAAQLYASPLVGSADPNYIYTAASGRADDLIVIFRDSTTSQQAEALFQSLGDSIVQPGYATKVYVVEPALGTDRASALAALYSSPLILAASPDGVDFPAKAESLAVSTDPATSPGSESTSTVASPIVDQIIVQFKTKPQAVSGVIASAPQSPLPDGGTGVVTDSPQHKAVQSIIEVLTPELQQQAAALIGSLGVSVVASTPSAGFYVVAPAAGSTPAATAAQFYASPLVGSADPNYIYTAASGRADDLIVIFQDSTTSQQAEALFQSLGDSIVQPGYATKVYVVEPALGTDRASALAALYSSPLIVAASPDGVDFPALVPNDPLFVTNQYNLGNIQAPVAWNVTTGNPSTVVAVLDSGINVSNSDLQNSNIDYADGYNVYTGQTGAQNLNGIADDTGHGTFVTGIIAAATNNAYGIAGVNWKAKILPIKVYYPDATNPDPFFDSFIAGINRAVQSSATVINYSYGGYTRYNQAEAMEINYAASNNCVVIVSAGNHPTSDSTYDPNNDNLQPGSTPEAPIKFYPVAYDLPNEISVEDVDRNNSRYQSNYGPNSVNLAAPGYNVLSTALPGAAGYNPTNNPDFAYGSGTSFAAPLVAGVAALISGETPNLTSNQLASRVKSAITFVPGLSQDTISGGVIDAAKAVRAQQGGDYDGDGMTDYALYDPVFAQFLITLSGTHDSNGNNINENIPFGTMGHTNIPFAADFNKDGKTDLAIYDQTAAQFEWQISGTTTFNKLPFGFASDRPVPLTGDYNGDGQTDFGVYDPMNGQFNIQYSGGGNYTFSLGPPVANDIPFSGDFNGDGLTDLAIYNPTTFQYKYQINGSSSPSTFTIGSAGDTFLPVNGDYNGDGKTDFAVYDQTAAEFIIDTPGVGQSIIPFGFAGHQDIPLTGYFNGNAKTDFAVYDPTNGHITVQNSRTLVVPADYRTNSGADNPAPVSRTKLI